MSEVSGRVHSFQSMGTVDGPGVRFVVFFQGCNLRCKCCHNPDTWDMCSGDEYTAFAVVSKVVRYKEYFSDNGGVTISGGEPLLQSRFAKEIFDLCHKEGINTCLDTSGCILNRDVKDLLEVTDRVLLDVKYTNNEQYLDNVGCSIDSVVEFLSYLNEKNIPVTLRQVIIPTVNDNEDNIMKLRDIAKEHKCVDKIELLPFHKICQSKYDKLGINFPFGSIKQADESTIKPLKHLLCGYCD